MAEAPTPSKGSSAASANAPIRCLVIQLARLGDTLQTLMALRAAQQLYPNLIIHFVARDRFADAVKRVPWIEKVYTLPTDALLGPVIRGERPLKQSMGEAARWLEPLTEHPWDLVVNWSYSESSSFLAGLLPARVKLGYTRRKDSTFSSADGWSHYIQAVVQERIPQNVHLTDILTTQLLTALQIHWGEPLNDGNSPVTSKSFFSLKIDEKEMSWSWRDLSKKWIGIQLGASSESKTWDAEKWAGVANRILERHPSYAIVLLGGPGEKPLARKVMALLDHRFANSRNVISIAGQTSFDLWASAVSRCQWLLSGDTAAIHLASVLGTRVLNVSVGPVRWNETGPYGNGHFIVTAALPCEGCERASLDPAAHGCRTDVSEEVVYGAWSFAANEWGRGRDATIETHFAQLGLGSHLNLARIYRARIRTTEDGGGVVYEPLSRGPLRIEEWSSMVMGHIARAWYCGWVPGVGQGLLRERVSSGLIQNLRQIEEASVVLMKICDEASRTSLSLHRRTRELPSQTLMDVEDQEELKTMGKKLTELEQLIDRMAAATPALKVFSCMSKVLMHNLEGTHLAELSLQSAGCYRQLRSGIEIIREWIRHTVTLAKPQMVKSKPRAEINH